MDTFYGACQEMEHKSPFVMHADEPAVLLGEDNGANPVEFVLAGLSGCMTTTLPNPVKIKIEVERIWRTTVRALNPKPER